MFSAADLHAEMGATGLADESVGRPEGLTTTVNLKRFLEVFNDIGRVVDMDDADADRLRRLATRLATPSAAAAWTADLRQ